jgi:hypothetical protein
MKGLILHRLTGLDAAVVLLLAGSAAALDSLAPTLAPYLKDYPSVPSHSLETSMICATEARD